MYFWEKKKIITNCYDSMVKPICEYFNLTQIEYDIIMFLHNYPQYVTAAEIVKVRKLTKSHVSGALKNLEENGYITREYIEGNKKSLAITLTDVANPVIEKGEKCQKDFWSILFNNVTDEEFEYAKEVFKKMCDNCEYEMQLHN